MTEQERLSAFRRSMTALAEADMKRLSAEMDTLVSAQEQREKALAAEGEDECIFSARQEAARILREQQAHAAAEGRKKLLCLRTTLTEELFEAVRRRLGEFAASANYMDFLTERVRKLRAAMPQEDAMLYLREADMHFADALMPLWNGEIHVAQDIALGGARAVSESGEMLADETLDASLREQDAWFRAHAEAVLSEGGTG